MEALLLSASIFLCVGSFSLVMWTIRQFMEDLGSTRDIELLEDHIFARDMSIIALEQDVEMWKMACDKLHKERGTDEAKTKDNIS